MQSSLERAHIHTFVRAGAIAMVTNVWMYEFAFRKHLHGPASAERSNLS
jgi:hypothetical protein